MSYVLLLLGGVGLGLLLGLLDESTVDLPPLVGYLLIPPLFLVGAYLWRAWSRQSLDRMEPWERRAALIAAVAYFGIVVGLVGVGILIIQLDIAYSLPAALLLIAATWFAFRLVRHWRWRHMDS